MQTILLGLVLSEAIVVNPRRNVFILGRAVMARSQSANPRDEFKYQPLSLVPASLLGSATVRGARFRRTSAGSQARVVEHDPDSSPPPSDFPTVGRGPVTSRGGHTYSGDELALKEYTAQDFS